MVPEPDTTRLKVQQRQREVAEQQLAGSAGEEEEAAPHERRAEKASYLRAKLEERERSERELDD
jgi:hypothetical protein